MMEMQVKLVSVHAQRGGPFDFTVQAECYKSCVETEPDSMAETLLEVRRLVPADLITDSKIRECA
jgi:hypothetical protein